MHRVLVVDLSPESLDLVLEQFTDLLLPFKFLRIVIDFFGVENSWDLGASFFDHRIDHRGSDSSGLEVVVSAHALLGPTSHFGKELLLPLIIEHLVRTQHASIILLLKTVNVLLFHGPMVQGVIQDAILPKELFVNLGPLDGLVGVDRDFEAVSHVLPGSQPAQEAAVL